MIAAIFYILGSIIMLPIAGYVVITMIQGFYNLID